MQYLKPIALPIMFLLGYAAFFHLQLFQSTQMISKSTQSLKDFEFDDAMSQADKAINLSPINADTYANKGYVYGILWIFRKENTYKRQMDESFQKAISLTPNNAVYYYKWSALYSDSGNYQEAVLYIDKAIQSDPYGWAYHLEKAFYLESLGRKSEALQTYQTAYDLGKSASIVPNINRLRSELNE